MLSSDIRGRYRVICVETNEQYTIYGCDLIYKAGTDMLVIKRVEGEAEYEVKNVDLSSVCLLGYDGKDPFVIPFIWEGDEHKNQIDILKCMEEDSRLPISEFWVGLDRDILIYGMEKNETIVSDLGMASMDIKTDQSMHISFKMFDELQKSGKFDFTSFHIIAPGFDEKLLDDLEEIINEKDMDFHRLLTSCKKSAIKYISFRGKNIRVELNLMNFQKLLTIQMEKQKYYLGRQTVESAKWKVLEELLASMDHLKSLMNKYNFVKE